MPDRGVVFDFDGVIARSMERHAEAYRRVLGPYGLRPTDHDIFLQEGARSETIIRDALRSVGVDDARLVRRLADDKQRTFHALGPIGLYGGARELVRSVADVTPYVALVTGTRRSNLDRIIPDLLPVFRAVLAQDAYTHDKPHPEPFEKAAAALGLPPGRCAALENAARGVASARAAGFGHVVAITTTLPEEELRAVGADVVVADHVAAGGALRRWLGAGETALGP